MKREAWTIQRIVYTLTREEVVQMIQAHARTPGGRWPIEISKVEGLADQVTITTEYQDEEILTDEKGEASSHRRPSPQVNPKALTLADFIVGAVEVLTAIPHWRSIGAIENTAEFHMGREQWKELREALKDYRGTRSRGDSNG